MSRSVTVPGNKVHRCHGCGCRFQFHTIIRSGVLDQISEPSEAMRKSIVERVTRHAQNHAQDQVSCPHCGALQPEMIAAARYTLFAIATVFALFAGFSLVFVMYNEPGAPYIVAIAACGAAAFFAAALYLSFFKQRPRNIESVVIEPAIEQSKGHGDLRRQRTLRATPAVMVALGFMAVFTIYLIGLVQGWPLNFSWSPPCFGPGDEAYTYFPDRIRSLGGYWAGKSSVVARVPDDEPFELNSSSRRKDWRDSITADRDDSVSPWILVQFPRDISLVGKNIELAMHLDVTYPVAQGGGFDDVERSLDLNTDVQLASPGVAETMVLAWRLSMTGAALLVILGLLFGAVVTALQRRHDGEFIPDSGV